jgi:hypothetical protein
LVPQLVPERSDSEFTHDARDALTSSHPLRRSQLRRG